MRGVRSLSGIAGPGASLTQAGGVRGGNAGAAVLLDPALTSWVVPDGVTKVSILCIGSGSSKHSGYPGNFSSVSRSGSAICLAPGGYDPTVAVGDAHYAAPGKVPMYSAQTVHINDQPKALRDSPAGQYGGAGIDLFGENSLGQVRMVHGGYFQSGTSHRYYHYYAGGPGAIAHYLDGQVGTLSYTNDVPVVPGESLDVVVGAGPVNYSYSATSNSGTYYGCPGAVVACWGAGSYPRLTTIPTKVTYSLEA